MKLAFTKYQGTGNDFIMVDNRQGQLSKKDAKTIARLCDRKFGIGADGLIALAPDPLAAFQMDYYNADGGLGSLCGNGSRCAVAFAQSLGMLPQDSFAFRAADGLHQARMEGEVIHIHMADVGPITVEAEGCFVNTGSPHWVLWEAELDILDVNHLGRLWRWQDRFAPGGTNVNFVQVLGEGQLRLRTFERGVEAETLSCGTGATAAALCSYATGQQSQTRVRIAVEGGQLQVRFTPTAQGFTDIWLSGPAQASFEGSITL